MHIHGSICALVTPFDAREQIDFDALDRLIAWHIASGTKALVLAGSTGEAALLDDAEFRQLLEHSVARVARRIPVIAGIGSPSTRKSLAYADSAAAAGADALLAVTPYYVRPTQHGLLAHYQYLADHVSLPMILYNVPGRTGCDLLPATVAELSLHPGIVGVKEANPDAERMTALLACQSSEFVVLSGDDPTALRAMRAGARGTISVAANVVPGLFAQLCEQTATNPHEAARLDAALQELYRVLGLESNPIPVKWALHRLGYLQPQHRLPLTVLSARHHGAIDDCLAALASLDAAFAA